MTEEKHKELEKIAIDIIKNHSHKLVKNFTEEDLINRDLTIFFAGYNKAKEEMQEQDYSLFDFAMQYENGKFKCKYKSGKEFESVDGETWKEIVLPELKESE